MGMIYVLEICGLRMNSAVFLAKIEDKDDHFFFLINFGFLMKLI